MTATSNKAIAAHLAFTFEVRFSVEATEAKWKELTKDYYRDPNKKLKDEEESIIKCFIQGELDHVFHAELREGLLAYMPTDLFFGLKNTKPVLEWTRLDDYELEVLE